MILAVPATVADHGTTTDELECATTPDFDPQSLTGAIAVGPYYIGDTFIYEESNNMEGLQRGSDPSQVIPDFPDIVDCSHPDTIIL